MNIRELEEQLAKAQEDVGVCKTMLELEPDDADAKETLASVEELVADLQAQLDAARAATPPPPPALPPPPPPSVPKYDMKQHPKFRDAPSPPPPPPPPEDTGFNVKDAVMAKWTEDKQWYQATVVGKTGSAHDPIYTVKFRGYGNTETKRKHEIRAYHSTDNKKRKADGSPVVVSASPAQFRPHVISAAPAVDRNLVEQRREPSKVTDGPARLPPEPKRLKGNKALEKGKANWQAWNTKRPGKAGLPKRDSMFRTPDLPNAKVGFTGSGKPMKKDAARKRWEYDQED
ncbi:hypothetical protein K470DRAFT_257830 [Piedraia hortae CBS 480.64]|uniref:Tudor domain-containing protein n=1 Tax=Piedraia hortae CBS 480.64 TaxID=1314780 RepID=A0A6A7C1N1_9PEZI|nr:hypothetical protein K470DRAFT_257830 [Piedraia hortae CBS 480.64]